MDLDLDLENVPEYPNEELEELIDLFTDVFDEFLPEGFMASVILCKDDGNGNVAHISNFDPLMEARGLREMANKLEKMVAETN